VKLDSDYSRTGHKFLAFTTSFVEDMCVASNHQRPFRTSKSDLCQGAVANVFFAFARWITSITIPRFPALLNLPLHPVTCHVQPVTSTLPLRVRVFSDLVSDGSMML
jgi:hypothetical protein